MPENLGRIVAKFKELPSTSPFCKTTEQYAREQYIRVIHESNALEGEGPKSESQTKKLGDDLAYHLLTFHRMKLRNCADDVKELKKAIISFRRLSPEERTSNSKDFLIGNLEHGYKEISEYLSSHGVDLKEKPKNPVVTQHVSAFCNCIHITKMITILSRELFAESLMTEHSPDFDELDAILLKLLCFVHHVLMTGIHPEAGSWKSKQNSMGHEGPITYAPENVDGAMRKWMKKLRELLSLVHLLELNIFDVAAWATHSFLVIHPFGDGNGRMSRIILNSLLISFGEVPFPIVITDGTSSGKTKYVKALRKVDSKEESLFHFGNLNHMAPYTKLIMDGVMKSFQMIDSRTKDQEGEDYRSIL